MQQRPSTKRILEALWKQYTKLALEAAIWRARKHSVPNALEMGDTGIEPVTISL